MVILFYNEIYWNFNYRGWLNVERSRKEKVEQKRKE